ncbi:MAG: helix-turn-helix transcriptional regulator [Dehalococcoidia bacterium]
MNTVVVDYKAAEAQENQLNARQREVMRLVAEGRTNPEIATQFDITLDGAKWNVSEILTKLGLSSREEIAAYYRWRRRPAHRVGGLVRGLAALPAIKWVAGGAAATAIAVGAILVALSLSSDAKEQPLVAPFTLEARIEVEETIDAVTIGTSLPGAGIASPAVRHVSELRWSYRDNDRYRWEIDRLDPIIDRGTLLVVSNDDGYWSANSQTKTYSRSPLPDFPDTALLYPGGGFTLGPIPPVSSRANLAQMFGQGQAGFRFEAVGSSVILGRPVTVFEFSPVGTSSDENGVDQPDGSGTLYVDESAWVLLRFALTTKHSRVNAVVTRFDPAWRPDRKLLTFVPPAGFTETAALQGWALAPVSGTSSSGPAGGVKVDVPLGFLPLDAVPEGFEAVTTESETLDGDEPTGFFVHYRREIPSGDVQQLKVAQAKRADRPQPRPSDSDVAIGATTGHLAGAAPHLDLYWWKDGILVVLTGDGVPEAELVAIAEAMTRP